MSFFTKTRIIGILLLVIAVLGVLAKKPGAAWLGVLGIILLIAPSKHTQHMLDLFTTSFTGWKTIIITALYDAVYYSLLRLAWEFVKWQLQVKAAAAESQSTLTQTALANPELVAQNIIAAQSMLGFMLAAGIGILIFSFITYTISRGLIWTTIAQQKFNKTFLLKFAGLNALWWLVWAPFFILVSLAGKTSPYVKDSYLAILFIAMYFTPIVHILYMKKHLIGYSIGNGLGWGISKIHRLIIPYSFGLVIWIIAYQLFRLFATTIYIEAAWWLFVVLFIAWLRTYLYHAIQTFK